MDDFLYWLGWLRIDCNDRTAEDSSVNSFNRLIMENLAQPKAQSFSIHYQKTSQTCFLTDICSSYLSNPQNEILMVSHGQGEGSSLCNRAGCDFPGCQQSLAHYASKNAHIEPSHSECCGKMLSPPTDCGWLCKGGFSTGTACYCVAWRESQLPGDKYKQSGLCWELFAHSPGTAGVPLASSWHWRIARWVKPEWNALGNHIGTCRKQNKGWHLSAGDSQLLPSPGATVCFFCTLASGSPIPSSLRPSWWLSYWFSSEPDSVRVFYSSCRD